GGRVYNIGLMQDRQSGMIAGGFFALLGFLFAATGTAGLRRGGDDFHLRWGGDFRMRRSSDRPASTPKGVRPIIPVAIGVAAFFLSATFVLLGAYLAFLLSPSAAPP